MLKLSRTLPRDEELGVFEIENWWSGNNPENLNRQYLGPWASERDSDDNSESVQINHSSSNVNVVVLSIQVKW